MAKRVVSRSRTQRFFLPVGLPRDSLASFFATLPYFCRVFFPPSRVAGCRRAAQLSKQLPDSSDATSSNGDASVGGPHSSFTFHRSLEAVVEGKSVSSYAEGSVENARKVRPGVKVRDSGRSKAEVSEQRGKVGSSGRRASTTLQPKLFFSHEPLKAVMENAGSLRRTFEGCRFEPHYTDRVRCSRRERPGSRDPSSRHSRLYTFILCAGKNRETEVKQMGW